MNDLEEVCLPLAVLTDEEDLAGAQRELTVLQISEVEEPQPLKAHQDQRSGARPGRRGQSSCMGMMMLVYPSSGEGFSVMALFTSLNSMVTVSVPISRRGSLMYMQFTANDIWGPVYSQGSSSVATPSSLSLDMMVSAPSEREKTTLRDFCSTSRETRRRASSSDLFSTVARNFCASGITRR